MLSIGYYWVITGINIIYIFCSFATWVCRCIVGCRALGTCGGMGTQVLSTSAPRVVGFIYI